MVFKDYLENSRQEIEKEVSRILVRWGKEVANTSLTLAPLITAFKKANTGGKKIRGALVCFGYEIAQGSKADKEDIIKVAAAYEIFHTGILAHDDIIDQSIQRRGKPSLHQVLGGRHYGISQAICLADCGFFLALKIISGTDFPHQNLATRFFAQTALDTAVGQMLDIEQGDAVTIMKLKTAKYTISGPLEIGAILAGAGQGLLRLLEVFGENLGVAFQIQDDILDGESKEAEKDQAKALKYASQAKKLAAKITKNSKISKLLESMCDYVVERRK